MTARPAAALLLLCAVVCFAACGTSSASAPAAPAPQIPSGTAYSLSFSPGAVQPGVENTQCVVLRLGNPAPIHVGSIHNTLSNGSHHMIVYRSNETVEQTTPFDCIPFTDTLDANQMVRIELHYINPTPQPVDVVATTSFITIDDSQFKQEADFLFIGDPDITIPPNSSTTLGPIFFQLPPEYAGSQFFAITGHEHKLGTDVTVSVASSSSDPGTPVYDVPDWLWSEPATVVSSPPFTVPENGGFRFTCEWTNTTTQTVKFGESANDEMCFFWAYYYPSQGARVCVHTEQVSGGLDVCCPGPSLICAYIQGRLADGG